MLATIDHSFCSCDDSRVSYGPGLRAFVTQTTGGESFLPLLRTENVSYEFEICKDIIAVV